MAFTMMPLTASAETAADDAAGNGGAGEDAVRDVPVQLHNPSIAGDGTATWDCIYFGKYFYVAAEGSTLKGDIRWRVLEVSDTDGDGVLDDAFLMADRSVDFRKYNEEYHGVTWETCTLRSWLNGYDADVNLEGVDYSEGNSKGNSNFIDEAFNDDEKAALKTTNVINGKNPASGSDCGRNTQDKVFLLSAQEMTEEKYGFVVQGDDKYGSRSRNRISKTTYYVAGNIKRIYNGDGDKDKPRNYWLRTTNGGWSAVLAMYDGRVNTEGWNVDGVHGFWEAPPLVRPAIHIDISDTSLWTYAGTCASDDTDKLGITDVTIPKETCIYDGTDGVEFTPEPTVRGRNAEGSVVTLTRGTDYTVEYSNNTEPGRATVTVTGTGDYSGTATTQFRIYHKDRVPVHNPTVEVTSGPGEDAFDFTSSATWDSIYFGSYPQSYDGEEGFATEPIKWRVLETTDTDGDGDADEAFVISDKNLDAQPYNTTYTAVTWESSTVRSWLNGYDASANQQGTDYSDDNFIDTAFTAEEKDAIKVTEVKNKYNMTYATKAGNDTRDRIYLLSDREVFNIAYGFDGPAQRGNMNSRKADDTDYIAERKTYNKETSKNYYLLRTPGDKQSKVVCVAADGKVKQDGHVVSYTDYAVRPVLRIDLNSTCWRNAGKVNDRNLEDVGDVTLPQENYIYNGAVIEPQPVVKFHNRTLTKDVDYSLEYANNDSVGTATVTVQGTGNYKGEVEKEFYIKTYDASPAAPVTNNGETTWDCIYFGNYYQSSAASKEPIKWRVLDVTDTNDDGKADDAFVVADQGLDAKPYNTIGYDITWESSTIRSWLNGYNADANDAKEDYSKNSFIRKAFTTGERNAILTTAVDKDANDNDVKDKIYLLSVEEASNADYGFNSDTEKLTRAREAKATPYAEQRGAYSYSGDTYKGNSGYWLRSPGYRASYAAVVSYDTYLNKRGTDVEATDLAVRPAMHIDLSRADWEPAGQVKADAAALGRITDSVLEKDEFMYTGEKIEPAIVIKSGDTVLTKDVDYTLEYVDNIEPGVAGAIIEGKGNYGGVISDIYYILETRLENAGITLESKSVLYAEDAEHKPIAHEPAVTVELEDKILEEGEDKDYTVSYSSNTEVGTATVTITATEGSVYMGTATRTFKILDNNIENAEITQEFTSVLYNGKPKTPAVTVTLNGAPLVEDQDFIANCSNNTNVGTATIEIKGKADYTGTVVKSFKINPKGTTLNKPVRLKKGFTARWAKQTAGMSAKRITGYQIRYSLKKNMAGAKLRTVKGCAKGSVTVKKLKAKKTYYIQVRTYMKTGGKTYYSPWSAKKSVKTKK